jgi:phospholipase/carboxylesterase
MALSTYLPLVEGFPFELNPANASVPIFYAHGTQDPVVPLQLAEHTRNELTARGCSILWHTYPMPHTVHPQEIMHMRAWLLSVLHAA